MRALDPMKLFDGWESIVHTLLAGIVAYTALIIFLRISGKRTLTKMNAFDFVVTVAIGSTLASVLTSKSLPLVDGIVALALLVALQYAVSWMTVRIGWFATMIKSTPGAVVVGGEFDEPAMRRERLSRDEVLMAVRDAGIHDFGQVSVVILETDGSLSVLKEPAPRSGLATTTDVRNIAPGNAVDSASLPPDRHNRAR